MDQCIPTREESSEEKDKTTRRNNALGGNLEDYCTAKKTALISTSGTLKGYHGSRQESCTSESSDFFS